MLAMVPPPASTTANLLYIVEPKGVGAYQYVNADPVTGERKRNFEREEKSVVVENIRGKESSVSLDTAGFQFYLHPAKHSAFVNDEEIRQEYYPESAKLIKAKTGASRVELFDHSELLRPIHFKILKATLCPFQLYVAAVQERLTIRLTVVSQFRKFTSIRLLLQQLHGSIDIFRPLTFPNFLNAVFR